MSMVIKPPQPNGYWRRGNVEVVCARYGIPLFDDFDEWLKSVQLGIWLR